MRRYGMFPIRPAYAAAIVFATAVGTTVPLTAGAATPGRQATYVYGAGKDRAVAIGDSVMLEAQPQLRREGVMVYAATDRAFIAGVDVAQSLRASGSLAPMVVIHLGTNGPVSRSLFDEMMSVLHGVRRVVFLTVKEPRPWE